MVSTYIIKKDNLFVSSYFSNSLILISSGSSLVPTDEIRLEKLLMNNQFVIFGDNSIDEMGFWQSHDDLDVIILSYTGLPG